MNLFSILLLASLALFSVEASSSPNQKALEKEKKRQLKKAKNAEVQRKLGKVSKQQTANINDNPVGQSAPVQNLFLLKPAGHSTYQDLLYCKSLIPHCESTAHPEPEYSSLTTNVTTTTTSTCSSVLSCETALLSEDYKPVWQREAEMMDVLRKEFGKVFWNTFRIKSKIGVGQKSDKIQMSVAEFMKEKFNLLESKCDLKAWRSLAVLHRKNLKRLQTKFEDLDPNWEQELNAVKAVKLKQFKWYMESKVEMLDSHEAVDLTDFICTILFKTSSEPTSNDYEFMRNFRDRLATTAVLDDRRTSTPDNTASTGSATTDLVSSNPSNPSAQPLTAANSYGLDSSFESEDDIIQLRPPGQTTPNDWTLYKKTIQPQYSSTTTTVTTTTTSTCSSGKSCETQRAKSSIVLPDDYKPVWQREAEMMDVLRKEFGKVFWNTFRIRSKIGVGERSEKTKTMKVAEFMKEKFTLLKSKSDLKAWKSLAVVHGKNLKNLQAKFAELYPTWDQELDTDKAEMLKKFISDVEAKMELLESFEGEEIIDYICTVLFKSSAEPSPYDDEYLRHARGLVADSKWPQVASNPPKQTADLADNLTSLPANKSTTESNPNSVPSNPSTPPSALPLPAENSSGQESSVWTVITELSSAITFLHNIAPKLPSRQKNELYQILSLMDEHMECKHYDERQDIIKKMAEKIKRLIPLLPNNEFGADIRRVLRFFSTYLPYLQ